jgi:phenylpyruvate tautomerase PptA (4-oxalocrotonate tautomerase family)
MPFVHIKSLPFQKSFDVPQVIEGISNDFAKATGVGLEHVTVTWEFLLPGHYAVAGVAVQHQPDDSHPVLVQLLAPDFATPAQIEKALLAVAASISKRAKTSSKNIFIHYRQAHSGLVFDDGDIVRWYTHPSMHCSRRSPRASGQRTMSDSRVYSNKEKAPCFHKGLSIFWCPEEDSNLHTLRHTDLNRARLPIPPSGHARIIAWPMKQNCREFTAERVCRKALCFRMCHASLWHKPLISIEFLQSVDFPWRNLSFGSLRRSTMQERG